MNKDQIIEAIKNMTVLELNELVKACEEEFGVSAAAPVAVAGAVAGGAAAAEEQSEFTVVLDCLLYTSKSLGNFRTVRDLLKVYDGEVLRFLILSGQYRGTIDFGEEILEQSKNGLTRMRNAKSNLVQDVYKRQLIREP